MAGPQQSPERGVDPRLTSSAKARGDLQAALDWVMSYLGRVRDLPVLSQNRPGEVEANLPLSAPKRGESIDAVLADMERVIVPGLTHWNHPKFFGYFAISSSGPGIAAELMTSAINSNGMLWRTAPAITELEMVATRWLGQMLRLSGWFGVINDTASSSTLFALAGARHAAFPEVKTAGLSGASKLAVYSSIEAHSSVDKAVLALGLGLEQLRKIPTDTDLAMDVTALSDAIEKDIANGVKPAAVVATVGTTAATAVDPVDEIASLCQTHGIWLHVDASYAGVTAALPELRWIFRGAERADSLVVNPHKWLFVPIDCSVLFLREPERVAQAFSVVPDYLQAQDEATNLMDYGIPLGRRFRALKLWMVLRMFGTDAIVGMIRSHIRMAKRLEGLIAGDPRFEIAYPARFSVVNARLSPDGATPEESDELTRRLIDAVNATGKAFITSASVGGRVCIHAAIGNLATTEADVTELYQLLSDEAGKV